MVRTARRSHGQSAADGGTTVGVAVVFDVSDDGGALESENVTKAMERQWVVRAGAMVVVASSWAGRRGAR